MREKAEGDTITIRVDGGKYDVATSALTLLTPEQFEAATDWNPRSPHPLNGLSDYLEKHNVLLLSDGTTPKLTAKSDSTDFLYLGIPALLLVAIGFFCNQSEDGSIILPGIGLIIMLSQIIIFAAIIWGTGVSIQAIELFIIAALFIGLLIGAANLYAGLSMCSAIKRYSHFEVKGKSILKSFGVGFLVLVVYAVIIEYGLRISTKSEYYGILMFSSYMVAVISGLLWFFRYLKKQQPNATKPVALFIAIFLLTILFAGLARIPQHLHCTQRKPAWRYRYWKW